MAGGSQQQGVCQHECQLVQLAIVRRLDENVVHLLAGFAAFESQARGWVCGGKLETLLGEA